MALRHGFKQAQVLHQTDEYAQSPFRVLVVNSISYKRQGLVAL